MVGQRRQQRGTLLVHRAASRHAKHRKIGNAAVQAAAPVAVAAPSPGSEEAQRQAELERELQMARDIQQGLLLAAVPYLRGWELSAVSNPARDLGGDLYDFLPLPDHNHAIMIGDVSGKGLPAALRMAVARTVFRHHARLGNSPADTLAAVNEGVCSDIPQGMVTMLYVVLDTQNGVVRVANAGHTYPLLLNSRVEEFELPGMPLGVDPEIDYEESTIQVEPGDSLFLYTDGVTEATNSKDVMFGTEYLHQLLAANIQYKPRALMGLLLRELRAWRPDTDQDDDITLVILRRRFTHLGEELRSIADDVLGPEKAADFWVNHIEPLGGASLQTMSPDAWTAILPDVTRVAKSSFNRGLARELSQQLRLAIEEYRGGGEK